MATVEPKKAKGILVKNSAFTAGAFGDKPKHADKENWVRHDPPKVMGIRSGSKGAFAKVNFKGDVNNGNASLDIDKQSSVKRDALKIAPQASQPSQRLQKLKP